MAAAFSSADNSFGFLRLMFAFAVLVSHSNPVGFGRDDPGGQLTKGQTDLGDIGILGFFLISGFLITRSTERVSVSRYLWRRGMRILPGLWVCLIVTAFVLAPVVALMERGTVGGLFGHPDGPAQYVANNWFIAVRQYSISDLLLDTPYGHRTGSSVFNGSLWSLVFEVLCYLLVGLLAAVGVLRRARWSVAIAVAFGAAIMIMNMIQGPNGPGPHGELLGFETLDNYSLFYLTYVFLIGSLFHLYRDNIVLNDGLAVVAALTLIGSLALGGFTVVGYPAFAYLVFWLAVRLPPWFRSVGRRHDYSYGFYIYAFPVQQILALAGANRLGLVGYILICGVTTFALAVPSWHFVERPAMGLKDWSPRDGIRRARPNAGPGRPTAEDAGTPAARSGTVA